MEKSHFEMPAGFPVSTGISVVSDLRSRRVPFQGTTPFYDQLAKPGATDWVFLKLRELVRSDVRPSHSALLAICR